MKIIKSFLLINIINWPLLQLSNVMHTNTKSKKISQEINDMHLGIFNHDIEDENDWNQIRNMVIKEFEEVIKKINADNMFKTSNYQINDFEFSGFKDEIYINNILKGFFQIIHLKDQITLQYNKYSVARSDLISHFQDIVKDKIIYEDNTSLGDAYHLREKWKVILYHWIGQQVNLNNEIIPVILKRFEFDHLEKKANNSFVAWFNYFYNHQLIPVNILINNKEKEIEKIKNEGKANHWIRRVFLGLAPPSIMAFILFCFITINNSKILVKVGNNYIDDLNAENYQMPLIESNVETIVNNYGNVVTVTHTNKNLLHRFLIRLIRTFLRTTKQSRFFAKSQNLLHQEDDDDIYDLEFDLKKWDTSYEEQLENVQMSDISHNLDFMKWGFFDPMRLGRIKIRNFPQEIVFKIFHPQFQQPSVELSAIFREKIAEIMDNAYISKTILNYDDFFPKVSRIILQILDQSKLIINGINYFFTSDSFWIDEIIPEVDGVKITLNHFLFKQPLIFTMPYL